MMRSLWKFLILSIILVLLFGCANYKLNYYKDEVNWTDQPSCDESDVAYTLYLLNPENGIKFKLGGSWQSNLRSIKDNFAKVSTSLSFTTVGGVPEDWSMQVDLVTPKILEPLIFSKQRHWGIKMDLEVIGSSDFLVRLFFTKIMISD